MGDQTAFLLILLSALKTKQKRNDEKHITLVALRNFDFVNVISFKAGTYTVLLSKDHEL